MEKKQLVKIFFIRALVLFIGWTILFNYYLIPHTHINEWLTSRSVYGTQSGLELLGYESDIEFRGGIVEGAGIVSINGEQAVKVDDPCNGLELFALFIGFLIAFPGPWLAKLTFSIIGSIVLFILNIIREVALALNYYHFRVSFDFNHKFTYAIMVYFVVLLLWRYWVNRYSAIAITSR